MDNILILKAHALIMAGKYKQAKVLLRKSKSAQAKDMLARIEGLEQAKKKLR